MGLRKLPGRVIPRLDEWVFNRDRDRVVADLLRDRRYRDVPGRVAQPTCPHLVVVPQAWGSGERWQPAQGTFLFEITQSAREILGAARVSVFEVLPDEQPADWHTRLLTYLIDEGATHLVAQIEADPHRTAERWTWDAFWTASSDRWLGVLLGVTFDSSWRWLAAQSRRLARISDRFMLIDICMPMDGQLVRGRREVGPVNMPVSQRSLDCILDQVSGTSRDIDVSFIGALYPDRVAALEVLADRGLSIAVNPHLPSPNPLREGVRHEASYIDYMRALARSRITVNFSRSNAGPFQQLKTRVLEAALMGAVIVTDDRDRTSRFWSPSSEFAQFRGLDDLGEVVMGLLEDKAALQAMSTAAQNRALTLHTAGLWAEVDRMLGERRLMRLKCSRVP